MELYSIIKHLHSGFRYIVLVLVVAAVINAFLGWFGNKAYTEGSRKLNVFALISAHVQFLIGLILYFWGKWYTNFAQMSELSDELRYWTVEHISMMLFAIVLITIGNSKAKKITLPQGKHRTIAIFFGLAILIIVVAIIQSKRGLFGMTS